MYSNKENVNILTSLLVEFGISKAVVCPGSRNSPIVHNLCECKEIECFPVTDERSAGFFAIGVALSEHEPVVVCVTSGSALLNLAPAVAEAYYQNIPLVVISADRPQQWIGQQDGQTIQQMNALLPNVRKSVNIPEPNSEEERWYCNRLVNEALLASTHYEGGPVHINVPLSEPLFEYTVKKLPKERRISHSLPEGDLISMADIAAEFAKAKKPMLVIGQVSADEIGEAIGQIDRLCENTVVLYEKLADDSISPALHFDEVLSAFADDDGLRPDFLVYTGGTIVSKRLKKFLRGCRDIRSVWLDKRGEVCDTFMNLTDVVQGSIGDFAEMLADEMQGKQPNVFAKRWKKELELAAQYAEEYQPDYSQMLAVKRFHEWLQKSDSDGEMVYGNSSVVRLGNIYSDQYIYVNRGVNGIEGTLSVAVGLSVARKDYEDVYCVVGDLSFFYDQNALWNRNLDANLGILLLNNGGGGLFRQLPGLEKSPYLDEFVGASHDATAEGICAENDIVYLSAHNTVELEQGLKAFFSSEEGPILLEVFTDAEFDAKVIKDYYEGYKKKVMK